MSDELILARRLGVTVHVSSLRMKLQALSERFPSRGCRCLEDWLVDVANARNARIVTRTEELDPGFRAPTEEECSNEELVAGICQLQCLDRPQMLRLAAQLVSRGAVRFDELRRLAVRERAGLVLGELARQALRAAPDHVLWKKLADQFPSTGPLRSPILHWTRLAQPLMKDGRCNAASWKLVA